MHGVLDLINEAPEFVHEKLDEMRKELSGICHEEKKAYDMLLIENDQRVLQSDDYLLAFLRADCFDASKAPLSWHIQFVRSRRSLEEKHQRTSDNSSLEDAPKPSNGDFVGIESPGKNDVLCGVESLARNHIGNFRYLSYIEAHFEEYNSIEDRLERKAFFDKVFSLVVGPGGRFLQRDEATGLWIPVKDSVALEKIGNSFRTLRKKEKRCERNQQKQTTGGRRKSKEKKRSR